MNCWCPYPHLSSYDVSVELRTEEDHQNCSKVLGCVVSQSLVDNVVDGSAVQSRVCV